MLFHVQTQTLFASKKHSLRTERILTVKALNGLVFNRTLSKKNSRKGSGGIGILVKEDILHLYNIEVVTK